MHDPVADNVGADHPWTNDFGSEALVPVDPVSGLDGVRSRRVLLSWAGQLGILPVAQRESMQGTHDKAMAL